VVNPNGLATNAWFEWGIDNTALTGRSPDFPTGSAATDNQVVFTATGLQQRTTYYFRIAAINSAGKEAQGEIRSFSTPPLPTAITSSPTDVSTSSAKMNGTVNPNGLQTLVWFEWGTDNNLVDYSTTADQVIGSGIDNQAINATIFVSAGGTYSYRIAASNPAGVSKGEIVHFQSYRFAEATTEAATSITLNGAVLNGSVNPNGFDTTAWFEYGLEPSLSNPSVTDNQLIGAGSTTLPFSRNIPGLAPYTTWYFRAVASNAGGTQKGAIKSFLTGEYYVAVGDSITFGQGDDFSPDDTSLDGRNTGGGFEPILNNLLTAAKGIPQNIANEGVGGTSSEDGAGSISSILSRHPNAKYFLILYGTNDAFTNSGAFVPVPRDEYKNNMRVIISAIKAAGKTPYLAKVPHTTDPRYSDDSIRQYNAAIDELVAENGITVAPPDFYDHFLGHTEQLSDGLHPNGTGYQSMAALWFGALP